MDRDRDDKKAEKVRRWGRYDDLESVEEDWDERNRDVPLKDQRRRHRDSEEADERRESERRCHRPRHGGHGQKS